MTLGVNVDSAEAVDAVFATALAAGAQPIATPVHREWGGGA